LLDYGKVPALRDLRAGGFVEGITTKTKEGIMNKFRRWPNNFNAYFDSGPGIIMLLSVGLAMWVVFKTDLTANFTETDALILAALIIAMRYAVTKAWFWRLVL